MTALGMGPTVNTRANGPTVTPTKDASDGIEEDILVRAIGDLGIAVTGETAVWEEGLTVDTPLSASAERVHAVLAATRQSQRGGGVSSTLCATAVSNTMSRGQLSTTSR